MPDFTTYFSEGKWLFAILIVIGLAFWGTIIFFIVRAIRRAFDLDHHKISYDKQHVMQTVKNNVSDKDNVFLTNDLTYQMANTFCSSFCKNSDKNYQHYLEHPSAEPYLETDASIVINDRAVSASVNRPWFAVSEPEHVTLLSWEGANLQPLTNPNDIYNFSLALGECIETILNTPTVKKTMPFKEYEITVKCGDFDSIQQYLSSHIIVNLKTKNPIYKEPTPPKKWY